MSMNIPPNVLHSECSEHIESEMAEQVIEYMREIVKGHGLHDDSVSRVLALIVTDLSHEKDPDMHIKGQQFGADYQRCMCKRIDGGGK